MPSEEMRRPLSDKKGRLTNSIAILSLAVPLFCLLIYLLAIAHLDAARFLTFIIYLFLPFILGSALLIAVSILGGVQGKYKTIAISAITLDIILIVLRLIGGEWSF